jgi:hypothetical protein
MSDDYKEWIEEKTGKVMTSNVEKDSEELTQLQTQIINLKTTYEAEKETLEATSKDKIVGTTVFSPETLDATKKSELGITSMNAFAEALLNNKNGEGYDKVTGWTSDDVIATYVGGFSSENIYGVSGFDILIMLDTGIIKTRIETTRENNSNEDRYKMLLEDDNKVEVIEVNQVINYENNSMIFDSNGISFDKKNLIKPTSYAIGIQNKGKNKS